MALETPFEKETCSRCGGSGRYSFNLTHGSTCFKCGGKGETLTKRGYVARMRYVESCMVETRQIVVGDYVRFGSVTLGGSPYDFKAKVEEVADVKQGYLDNGVKFERDMISLRCTRGGVRHSQMNSPETSVRKYWPKEVNDAKIAEALAYQETLTKAGKPSKR